MWTADQLKSNLAMGYRDAADADADMHKAVRSFEAVRRSLSATDDHFTAWDSLDNHVASAFGERHSQALLDFRERFVTELVESSRKQIQQDRLSNKSQVDPQRFLTLYADSLVKWRQRIHSSLAAIRFDCGEKYYETVKLVQESDRFVMDQRWCDSYSLYATLADLEFLRSDVRARLLVLASQIQEYQFQSSKLAQNLLDKARTISADVPDVVITEGSYLLRNGRVDEARYKAHLVLEQDSGNVEALCLLGDCDKEETDLEKAESRYRDAIAQRPGSPVAYDRIIALYGEPGLPSTVLSRIPDLVDRAVQAEPTSWADYMISAGNARRKRGNNDRAHWWFSQVIERDPDHLRAHSAKADLLVQQDEPAEATSAYEHLIEIAPDWIEGYWGRGLLAENAGQLTDAERIYRTGSERVNQQRERLQARAAFVTWRLGRRQEAIDQLTELFSTGSEDPFLLRTAEQLVSYVNQENGLEDAAGLCNALVEVTTDGTAGQLHAIKGELLAGSEDYKGAVRELKTAIQLDIEEPRHYVSLIRTYRLAQDWEGGKRIAENSSDAVKRDPGFVRELGFLYNAEGNENFDRGEYADSIQLYLHATELLPEDAVLHSNLAQAYELNSSEPILTRLSASLDALKRAHELAPGDDYANRIWAQTSQVRLLQTYGSRAFEYLPAAAPISIEFSPDMEHKVSSESGELNSDLGDMFTEMRERIRFRFGINVPGVRVRLDHDLDDRRYALIFFDGVVARGLLPPIHDLANGSLAGDGIEQLSTSATSALDDVQETNAQGEPSEEVELDTEKSKQVYDAGLKELELVVQHLTSEIENNLHRFVGIQEIYRQLATEDENLLNDLSIHRSGLTDLCSVVKALLMDRIPIPSISTLCSRFLEEYERNQELFPIVEVLRAEYVGRLFESEPSATLVHYGLSEVLQESVRSSSVVAGPHRWVKLPVKRHMQLLSAVGSVTLPRFALVTEPDIRRHVQALLRSDFPSVSVISTKEIPHPDVSPIAGIVDVKREVDEGLHL